MVFRCRAGSRRPAGHVSFDCVSPSCVSEQQQRYCKDRDEQRPQRILKPMPTTASFRNRRTSGTTTLPFRIGWFVFSHEYTFPSHSCEWPHFAHCTCGRCHCKLIPVAEFRIDGFNRPTHNSAIDRMANIVFFLGTGRWVRSCFSCRSWFPPPPPSAFRIPCSLFTVLLSPHRSLLHFAF